MTSPAQGERGDPTEGPLSLAILLIALAGSVDAIGFLKLGHMFLSFMSGNSTQLAVNLTRGRVGEAAQGLALIVMFTLGSFTGPLVAAAAGDRRRRPTLLALEAALLGAAALVGGVEAAGPRVGVAVSLAAFAIGLQNAVQRRAQGAPVHPFVTGNLVSFAEALAHALLGRAGALECVKHILLWFGLLAGAAVGAGLYARVGLPALLAPATAYALLSVREAFQPAPKSELVR